MPAIAGFAGFHDSNRLYSMARVMSHRGEINEAHENFGYSNIVEIGHRRHTGHFYCDSDVPLIIAYCGTLYGQNLSLQQLSREYQSDPTNALNGLNGAYTLVIQTPEQTVLARDISGHRTVYYGMVNGEWHFASEPKSIHTLSTFKREIQISALAQYFTFSFVPGEHTMLKGLFEVPAGHSVILDHASGQRSIKRFFSYNRSTQAQCDNWEHRLRLSVQQAVCDRMPKSDSVGLFLSGGIDSSIVAAVLQQCFPGRTQSYAIHFGEDYPNELHFSRQVADHLKLDHQEILITPESLITRFREAIWHLDDPIGDPVTLPNFELARVISKDHRFVFNGEGGDPIFGGPKNIPMLLSHWYNTGESYETARASWYLASYRRAFDELSLLLAPDILREVDVHEHLEKLVLPYFQDNETNYFLDKLRNVNMQLKGAHLILPKIERMLGAWQMTPLSPLYDQRLIKMSYELPPELILRNGVEKVILKNTFKNDLPQEVIQRPKSGMRVPVHYWFKGELQQYAKKLLSKKNVRKVGIFNEKRVQQLLDYSMEEKYARFGLKIWMLLTFETWRRIIIDHETP